MTTSSGSISSENFTRFAVVAFPATAPGLYHYGIPAQIDSEVAVGARVKVQLRSTERWGVVLRIEASASVQMVKPLLAVQQGASYSTSPGLIKLYEWISSYYLCEISLLFRSYLGRRISSMGNRVQKLLVPSATAVSQGLTEKQQQALSLMREAAPGGLMASQWKIEHGISAHMLGVLQKKGVVTQQDEVVFRKADELQDHGENPPARPRASLSEEQAEVVEKIMHTAGEGFAAHLIWGITGSGKTHVYIELVKQVRSVGKGVLILVPEIALTPQTIARFQNALAEPIAVLHSNMNDGQRRDNMQMVMTGKINILIGVRSAVLVPITNLGLIIVDEEHDGSYKQSDLSPRYHARDVAVMRANLEKTLVVLGSATPSLETYYNAQNGKYSLHRLVNRFGAARIPRVEIVDMALEKRQGNWNILSRYLVDAISRCLSEKRQVMLLLNRRGFTRFLVCKDCATIAQCDQCSVHLVFHKKQNLLKCHQCSHSIPAYQQCPACGGSNFQYKGTAIQQAEEIIGQQFPQARILRMDQDVTRRRGEHARLINDFACGKADILLGTQMIAKGLNFPGVKLVGVIAADVGLHIPDFRAAERTFQLLTQVAGRAGRADDQGEVVVQTYMAETEVIRSSAAQDYELFYKHEIDTRQQLNYPPFARVIRILVTGTDCSKAHDLASQICAFISQHSSDTSLQLLGPAPALIEKVEARWRFSILLKMPGRIVPTLQLLKKVQKQFNQKQKQLDFKIDIDPQSLL